MRKVGLAKNLLMKIASLIISVLVGFIQAKLIVATIGSEAYGFYSLSNDFVNYAMIISIALNSMAGRYIGIAYHQSRHNESNGYFNSIFFANIVLSWCLLIPFGIVTVYLPYLVKIPLSLINDVQILFALMFVDFLLTIFMSVFSIATFIKNRVDLDSLRNIESNFIKLFLVIVFFGFLHARVWCLGVIVIISNVYVCFRNYRYTKLLLPEIKIKKELISKRQIAEVVKSGIWNCFTRVSSILLNGIDLLVANIFVGSLAMGTISIAKTIPKMFLSSMNSLAAVYTPKITENYAKNDSETLIGEISRSIKVNSIFSTGGLVVLFVLGESLYRLWMPSQDARMLQIISITAMLAYVVLMPFEVLWSIFTLANKVKLSSIYLCVESIITISTVWILLNITSDRFIKILIIVGISSVFELIRGMLFLPLVSAKLLNISKFTFYKVILRVLISFSISLAICVFICSYVHINSWFALVGTAIVMFIICCFICIVFTCDKKDREQLNVILKERFRK